MMANFNRTVTEDIPFAKGTQAARKRRLTVREGNAGVLTIRDEDGYEENLIPNYNLAPVRELLLEWQELMGQNGQRLKDSYWVNGINWMPTVVNYVYGRIFGLYVKYRSLIEQVLEGTLDLSVENSGDFSRILPLLDGSFAPRSVKASVFDALLALNNRLVVRRSSAPLLFFRFTPDDFRTKAAKDALDELDADYVEAVMPQKHALIASLLKGGTRYFITGMSARNMFRKSYLTEHLSDPKRLLFERTTEAIEIMMSTFIAEKRRHMRMLKGSSFQTFYAIDDTQIVFPLLYACQDQGVRTIAHQHGAAYHQWHASYVMENLEPTQIRWFDTLIVWDDYWKERFLALGNLKPRQDVVIGTDLYGDLFNPGDSDSADSSPRPRAVLLPYEFLANNYQIGRYVAKLLRLGHDVWFKPREDEDIENQIDTYCLPPDYRSRLKIVPVLTRTFLERIDVVAGTMSTLVYQLIPFGKVIWLLDTDYQSYLDHLADEGYFLRIRYEDLDTLNEQHFTRCKRDVSQFISPHSLKGALAKFVVPNGKGDDAC